jgi:hypothetical protein
MRLLLIIPLVILSVFIPKQLCGQAIYGKVIDAASGERLIGAQVYVTSTFRGTTTDAEGQFSLSKISTTDTLIIQYIGYATLRVFPVRVQKSLQEFRMFPEAVRGEDIVISAGAYAITNNRLSTIGINPVEMARLPSFLGQRDVFKSLQFFPGVVQGAEGSAGIYIRGGGMDQTQVLLDGIPLYQIQHAGGFTSAIHPDALQASTLLTGGFPASYGGRLGSVLDLKLKQGNENKPHVALNLGAVTADGFIETPLLTDKLTLIAGGRLATLPYTLRAFSRDLQNTIPNADFNDVLTKLTFKPGKLHKLELLYVRTDDRFTNDKVFDNTIQDPSGATINSLRKSGFGLNWGNELSGIRYTITPAVNVYMTAGLWKTSYAAVNKEFTDNLTNVNGIPVDRQVRDQRLKSGVSQQAYYVDLSWKALSWLSVESGFIQTEGAFSTEISQRFTTALDGKLPGISAFPDRLNQVEQAGYFSFRVQLPQRAEIETGLRAQAVRAGDSYTGRTLLPRVQLTYPVSSRVTFKTSAAKTVQTVHALMNGTTGINTDLWIPVTRETPLSLGWTYAAGATGPIKKGIEYSVEFYHRTMSNLVEYVEGANFMTSNASWRGQTTTGYGLSTGLEMYVRKSTGNLTGMISGSFSKSTRDFVSLNQGRTYRFKYDRPYVFSALGQYKLSKRTVVSLTFSAFSGQLVSLPMYAGLRFGFVMTGTEARHYYEAVASQFKNNYRLPAYHRADVAFQHQFLIAGTKNELRWGVYNLYNRWNVSYVTMYESFTGNGPQHIKLQPTYLFPITPFFSWGISL